MVRLDDEGREEAGVLEEASGVLRCRGGGGELEVRGHIRGISNETRTLYLESNGKAGSVFESGALADKPGSGTASDKWTYDPLDTRPGDAESEDDAGYIVSQHAVMNTYGNGAIYHSEPFGEATEISGFLKLNVWLSMDVPDTDLEADVYEILPSGDSVFLTGAAMRARYRESLREEKLLTPGKIENYVFDNFTFFSRRIAKGSRLRLFVHCPNTPGTEKNYNSGGVVAQETAKDARTAHVTLVHDAEHESALVLPIVR